MMVQLSEIAEDLPRPPCPMYENPSLMGAGLANLGNTCFLNAVLQCFTHTVPLVQGLRSFDHSTTCPYDKGFCVVCTLREHIELSLASSGRIVSPRKLVDNLNYFSSYFERFQQEDAHEFLQCLLDRLCSCMEINMQNKSSCSLSDSFVRQIFGGRLRSQLRCCKCGHCSDTFEPSIDLSLEIEGVDNLSAALESFTRVEKIGDGEENISCDNCKEEVIGEKQLTIDKPPLIQILQLKRFKSDGFFVEKITDFLKFPMEMDMQPFVSNSDDEYNGGLKYDLYAVLVHSGVSSDSGHYFCFIRGSPNTWHRLDDTEVARVSEDDVLREEAYILFYKRQGTPWFLSSVELQKASERLSNTSTSPRSVLDDMGSIAASFSGREEGSSCENADAAPSTPPPQSSSTCIRPKESLEVSARNSLEEATDPIPRVNESPGNIPSDDTGNMLRDGRSNQSLSKLLRSMPNKRSNQLLACISPDADSSFQNRTKKRRISHSDATRSRLEESPSSAMTWSVMEAAKESMASGDSNMVLQSMPNKRSNQLLACISPDAESSSQNRTKKPRISHSAATRSRLDESPSSAMTWSIMEAVKESMASGDSNMILQISSI